MSIEKLQEQIEELEQERDELACELASHNDELSNREQEGYERAMLDMENKIERAFYNGYKSGRDAGLSHYTGNSYESTLKAFLNYKMEQRL